MITIHYSNPKEILSFIKRNPSSQYMRAVLIDKETVNKHGTMLQNTYLAIQALVMEEGQAILHSYIEHAGQKVIGNDLEVLNVDDWKAVLVSKLSGYDENMESYPNWTEGFVVPEESKFSFLSWNQLKRTGEELTHGNTESALQIDDVELMDRRPATGEVPAFQADGVITATVQPPRQRGKNPQAP